jgi:hypothetical protein
MKTMNIAKRILAGAAILGMALSGAAVGAGAASASTVPVMYGAKINGWQASVKPAGIYFGNGGAPYITSLHWTSWNGTSASATGKLWTQKPGCSPSYMCGYTSRWAGVYLNTVRSHNGTRYYARMAVKFWYGGKWRWDTGWFGYQGGTLPWWQFPAVFPYL